MAKSGGKEDELQAVLIADNFDKKFLPFDVPVSLMSICGSTFLDYALEFLSFTDVKEVFILTSKQSDKIKGHVQKHWSGSDVQFKTTIFTSDENRNFGDAMRDVDKKGVIKSDFILLQCGFICNSNLKDAVKEHRNRRLKDKNCAMTLIFSDCSPNHLSRSRDKDIFVALQTTTNRVLYVQNVTDLTSNVNVPLDIFMQHENISTRFDLLDCNIAICSPQIPPLFSDNFDFETRGDVIKEILTNDEILGFQMHVNVLHDKTAVFVGDYHSYLMISQLIMERYWDPLVPDSLIANSDEAVYTWTKRNIYIQKDNRTIIKTAKLVKNVVVGRNCRISDGVVIENSVLGDNCVIGARSIIKNSILWNDVCFGTECNVNSSLLCSNVKLGDSVIVNERCVLLNNISLNSKQEIDPGTMLSKSKPHVEEIIAKAIDANVSREKIYKLNLNVRNKEVLVWPEWYDINMLEIVDDDDDDDDDEDVADFGRVDKFPGNEKAISGVKKANDISDDSDSEDENGDSFYSVVFDVLRRGYQDKIDCANMSLEINCAKPTYNVGLDKLNKMLTKAILELAKSKNNLNNLRPMLKYFMPLLKNYFKSPQSQRHCLTVFQSFASSNEEFKKNLSTVLLFLYEEEVLSEESILQWNETLHDPALTSSIAIFVEWLQHAEEESSDDDTD